VRGKCRMSRSPLANLDRFRFQWHGAAQTDTRRRRGRPTNEQTVGHRTGCLEAETAVEDGISNGNSRSQWTGRRHHTTVPRREHLQSFAGCNNGHIWAWTRRGRRRLISAGGLIAFYARFPLLSTCAYFQPFSPTVGAHFRTVKINVQCTTPCYFKIKERNWNDVYKCCKKISTGIFLQQFQKT